MSDYCDHAGKVAERLDSELAGLQASLSNLRCDLVNRTLRLAALEKQGTSIDRMEMYRDAERRVKVWHDRYDRRGEELDQAIRERDAMRDVVTAARRVVRAYEPFDGRGELFDLRAALTALDAKVTP